MIDCKVYLDKPRVRIAENAWEEFKRLRDDSADQEQAIEYILMQHISHIRKMLAADQLSGDGALIVTDIPNFDLALVDAHFPSLGQRETTLFSMAGASVVVHAITQRKSVIALRQ